VDAWRRGARGDRAHEPDSGRRSAGETDDSRARFEFATRGRNLRGRIPLGSDNALHILSVDADPPPPARTAEGSSTSVRPVCSVAPVTVQVRLRQRGDQPPTAEQVDELVEWLRRHRPAGRGTPRPEPVTPPPADAVEPPVPPLSPVLAVERPRGPLWALLAVSLGLAAALAAAVIL
jgi:hypothetical protein